MSNRKQAGFTLIELLVVIAIIAVLVAIGVTAFGSARNSADVSQRKAIMSDVANALSQYKIDNGAYPLAGEGNNANQNSAFETALADYLSNQDLPDDANFNYWVDGTGSRFCLVAGLGSGNVDQANCNGTTGAAGDATCNFTSTPDTSARWCVQSKL